MNMAEQWHILVVEDEEKLNKSIVQSLSKDGYAVQGVRSGSDAVQRLWSEKYDVVISDLKTPGADGFELLQWVRTYRPKTGTIMLGTSGSSAAWAQALEGGAVSYLQKPLDLHLLKEELRRLLQQTGFSANLDSFDLLDVIQIINMSRKNIALLVNIGLEERGILRFQLGELIWAEYGTLRGEEAFFALAAHKAGTVIHQPWNEQIAPNVTQPLSRLIFQALQYRVKYAVAQQMSGELPAVAPVQQTPQQAWDDDRPFVFLEEPAQSPFASSLPVSSPFPSFSHPLSPSPVAHQQGTNNNGGQSREWWQISGQLPRTSAPNNASADTQAANNDSPSIEANAPASGRRSTSGGMIIPSTIHRTPASQRGDLPSWLTDTPTRSDLPALRPSSLSQSVQMPVTPVPKPSMAEWQPPSPVAQSTELSKQAGPEQQSMTGSQKAVSTETALRRASSAEWQLGGAARQAPRLRASGPLQSLKLSRTTGDMPGPALNGRIESSPLPTTPPEVAAQRPESASMESESQSQAQPQLQRLMKRNYPALVTALQTLGYSIPGFIAAGVVSMDGQPIAQVAVDDLDISRMCEHFSRILQGVLNSLDEGIWGEHEDTVITSADRHILLRIVSGVRDSFQVLITTREADPLESLEVMANVEGAIGAALHQ